MVMIMKMSVAMMMMMMMIRRMLTIKLEFREYSECDVDCVNYQSTEIISM